MRFIPGSARVSRVTPGRLGLSASRRNSLPFSCWLEVAPLMPVRLEHKRSPGRFRVSDGLLNPSGGARNRPRNKSVLAQKKNELNKHFAHAPKFCLGNFHKIKTHVSPREAMPFTRFNVRRLPPPPPHPFNPSTV
jgi:hypothetical protein